MFTKDIVVVTLSANGSGHLFYVPYMKQETKIFNDTVTTFKDVKGVGIPEMIDWTKTFIEYAHKCNIYIYIKDYYKA